MFAVVVVVPLFSFEAGRIVSHHAPSNDAFRINEARRIARAFISLLFISLPDFFVATGTSFQSDGNVQATVTNRAAADGFVGAGRETGNQGIGAKHCSSVPRMKLVGYFFWLTHSECPSAKTMLAPSTP